MRSQTDELSRRSDSSEHYKQFLLYNIFVFKNKYTLLDDNAIIKLDHNMLFFELAKEMKLN